MRPSLSAVKGQHLLFLADDTISRLGPRTPEGIARLCSLIDDVRAGRVQHTAQAVQPPAAQGMPLKPSLGPFVPSLANPVPSALGAPSAPMGKAAPTPVVAPDAAPAAKPAERAPAEPARKRPSQYGM